MSDVSDSANLASGWKDYEKAARDIYEAILRREGSNAEVEHSVNVKGRSGVEHQVDVYWRYRQAGAPVLEAYDWRIIRDYGNPRLPPIFISNG
jgi:hypothetical protein